MLRKRACHFTKESLLSEHYLTGLERDTDVGAKISLRICHFYLRVISNLRNEISCVQE